MSKINILAIDLAKNVFQLHGVDKKGNVCLQKKLSRQKLKEYISKLPICTIAMECCGSAHYWGRKFTSYGHTVKLISPQYVKPYVKGNKNDSNDAQAIAEAASRPHMRFVPIKTLEQQEMKCLHKIREGFVKTRTKLSNQIRGFLAEFGITLKQGVNHLKRQIPLILEDAENELTSILREELALLYDELNHVDDRVKHYDRKITLKSKADERCQRLEKIAGVGPMIATAVSGLGDLSHMKNGRHFAAFLGLVPKQHSSGSTQRLLGISKRGDTYIRKLMIQGAHSVLIRLKFINVMTPNYIWLKGLVQRRGINRAAVALANKNARIIWRLLTSDQIFNSSLAWQNCQMVE